MSFAADAEARKQSEDDAQQMLKEMVSKAEESLSRDPWRHRSVGMRCATCIYFVRKQAIAPTAVGRCRRHAPTMNGYPVVYDSDWCGDHKLDENHR